MKHELTKEESAKIGKTINAQIAKLKPGKSPVAVRPFNQPDFTIETTSDSYVLTMTNFNKLNNIETPDWLKIESTSDTKITAPHSKTTDVVYMLRKSYEDYVADTSQPYTDSLTSQVKFFTKLWRGEGECLSTEQQQGLLGEMYAMAALYKVKKDEAIEAWDETSRASVDFDHDDWSLEAKSKSSGGGSIHVSSKQQLTHKGKKLILSVLDVGMDKKEGKLLPGIVESILDEMVSEGLTADELEGLKEKIEKNYPVFRYSMSFTSKWKVGDLVFFEIDEKSEPALFSKNLYSSINVSRGYELILTKMSASALGSLL